MTRPAPGETDLLNARLPTRSFDPGRLAEAAGALTQTCVACHAADLDRPSPR